jgi:hypothetical protein
MEKLSNVLSVCRQNDAPTSLHPDTVVDILAEAHGMSVPQMRALWRRAGLVPPSEEKRVLKFKCSPNLVPELKRRGAERADAVLKKAIDTAFSVTHLEKISEKKPKLIELLALIKEPKLRAFAERFDPEKHGGALVLGPSGIGKTISALCVMIRCMTSEAVLDYESDLTLPFGDFHIINKPKSWASFDARDIGLAVQHAGLNGPDPSVLVKAQSVDCLILEDLGWERSFHVEALIDVAAPRYRRGLPTIVTSGEKHETLRERYTDAVLRRFWNVDGKDGAIINCWGNQ